jgi:hypothetical protein
MRRSPFKPKEAKCLDCPRVGPVTAGRCGFCYKKYRAGICAERNKDKPVAPRTPIKPVSDKRERILELYHVARAAHLATHKQCECGLPGCKEKATEIHHKSGRLGTNMLDTRTWLAVCRPCHVKIERFSDIAIILDLSTYRNKSGQAMEETREQKVARATEAEQNLRAYFASTELPKQPFTMSAGIIVHDCEKFVKSAMIALANYPVLSRFWRIAYYHLHLLREYLKQRHEQATNHTGD